MGGGWIMKVNTIEQYKIIQFIREHFEIDFIDIEIVNRYSLKVIDHVGDSIVFTYDKDEIKY